MVHIAKRGFRVKTAKEKTQQLASIKAKRGFRVKTAKKKTQQLASIKAIHQCQSQLTLRKCIQSLKKQRRKILPCTLTEKFWSSVRKPSKRKYLLSSDDEESASKKPLLLTTPERTQTSHHDISSEKIRHPLVITSDVKKYASKKLPLTTPKHPACVILFGHQSDRSLQDSEEITKEILPTSATGGTKAILAAVQEAENLPATVSAVGTQGQSYDKMDQESQVDMPVIDCVLRESDQQSVELNEKLLSTNKSVQFNYLVPFTDNISQLIKINKRRLYTVNGSDEQTLSWEEHGITIFIPKDALPSFVASCDIAVVPIVEGSFIFPDDTTPVSAIYAIGVSCKLAKPIRISIQHCVELTDPSHCELMCFAKAEHVGRSPPYQFEVLSDGVFTVGSEYGTIETASFTLFGNLRRRLSRILWPMDRYKLLQFHKCTLSRIRTVHFTMTKNIQSHIQDVIDEMKSSQLVKKGELLLSFGGPEIVLIVEKQSINGWDISPAQMPCKILKDDIDQYCFQGGSLPEVAVNFIIQENAEAIFCHDITITGSTEDSASINICLEKDPDTSLYCAPQSEVRHSISTEGYSRYHEGQDVHSDDQSSQRHSSSRPSESQLRKTQLAEVIQALRQNQFDNTKWRSVGLSLGLYDNTLSAIEHNSNDVKECLYKTLTAWLERSDGVSEKGGASWQSLANALRDNNLTAVAENIEEKS